MSPLRDGRSCPQKSPCDSQGIESSPPDECSTTTKIVTIESDNRLDILYVILTIFFRYGQSSGGHDWSLVSSVPDTDSVDLDGTVFHWSPGYGSRSVILSYGSEDPDRICKK